MDDLNDYRYFSEVVTHGGFSAASRVLLVPKSKLSRRVADLERRFGVKLIDRSPHRFRVTPVGQDFYDRTRAMLAEADRARSAVCAAAGEPAGVLRMSCPPDLLDACVADVLPEFLALYPNVDLHVLALDRPVDLVEERVQVSVRPLPLGAGAVAEANVTRLGPAREVLVASPAFEAAHPLDGPAALDRVATISLLDPVSRWTEADSWTLQDAGGDSISVAHHPRRLCRSLPTAMQAVLAGLGVALLPEKGCAAALAAGDLVRVLPAWSRVSEDIALITTERRGLPSAVTALVDFLEARLGHPVDDESASAPSRSDARGTVAGGARAS